MRISTGSRGKGAQRETADLIREDQREPDDHNRQSGDDPGGHGAEAFPSAGNLRCLVRPHRGF